MCWVSRHRGLRDRELAWCPTLKVTGDQSTEREKSLALGDTKGAFGCLGEHTPFHIGVGSVVCRGQRTSVVWLTHKVNSLWFYFMSNNSHELGQKTRERKTLEPGLGNTNSRRFSLYCSSTNISR